MSIELIPLMKVVTCSSWIVPAHVRGSLTENALHSFLRQSLILSVGSPFLMVGMLLGSLSSILNSEP